MTHELEKRFFELDVNDGGITYTVVATDLQHAEQLMRDSGHEFGDPSEKYDAAKTRGVLSWTEMSPDRVAHKTRCHTEDDRGVIPLADACIGEWFCSEW